jgi:hypothetical protein
MNFLYRERHQLKVPPKTVPTKVFTGLPARELVIRSWFHLLLKTERNHRHRAMLTCEEAQNRRRRDSSRQVCPVIQMKRGMYMRLLFRTNLFCDILFQLLNKFRIRNGINTSMVLCSLRRAGLVMPDSSRPTLAASFKITPTSLRLHDQDGSVPFVFPDQNHWNA